MPDTRDVLIVGGGPAGLACAVALHRAGRRPLVLESQEGPGGRLGTEVIDGHLVDRGFAVINTSYPALRRYAPVPRLDLQPIPAGATVLWEGRAYAVGNPLRLPSSLPGSVAAPFLGIRDLLALARLTTPLLRSNRAAVRGDDTSALQWFRDGGVSEQCIDAFLRPFFAGVTLDPTLAVSAKVVRYDLRQFAVGGTGLPARGMRGLGEYMSSRMPRGDLLHGARVDALLRADPVRVDGVRLADGRELRARAVVVATEAPEARRLTGVQSIPEACTGEVAVWAAVDRPLLPGGRLWLDPRPEAVFRNAAEPSASAPSYAPTGGAGVVLVAPGGVVHGEAPNDPRVAGWDDAQWSEAALAALHGWFPALPAGAARILAVQRLPIGQSWQPPGVHAERQRLRRTGENLVHAGEHTLASSLNAAMFSGERAARAVEAVLAG